MYLSSLSNFRNSKRVRVSFKITEFLYMSYMCDAIVVWSKWMGRKRILVSGWNGLVCPKPIVWFCCLCFVFFVRSVSTPLSLCDCGKNDNNNQFHIIHAMFVLLGERWAKIFFFFFLVLPQKQQSIDGWWCEESINDTYNNNNDYSKTHARIAQKSIWSNRFGDEFPLHHTHTKQQWTEWKTRKISRKWETFY